LLLEDHSRRCGPKCSWFLAGLGSLIIVVHLYSSDVWLIKD